MTGLSGLAGAGLLLLRHGFFRLRRQPALGAAAAGAALVVGLAAAAGALYARSAGAGAVDAQLAQLCPAEVGVQASRSLPGAHVAAVPGLSHTLERELAGELVASSVSSSALGAPITTTLASQMLSISASRGGTEVVRVMARTGAFGHVHVLRGTASAGGVLVPSGIAHELGVRPGGRVRLAVGGRARRIPVAGVYQDMTGQSVLTDFWCGQRLTIDGTAQQEEAGFPPPPLLLVRPASFAAVVRSLRVPGISVEWERPLRQGHVSLGAAAALDRDLARAPAWSPPNALGLLVRRARALQQSVEGAIAPVALAGLAVAFGLVAAASVYWLERRRRELELLRGRGLGPLAVAAQAVAEAGIWVLAGALCGGALALGLVLRLGPSAALGSGAWQTALVRSAVGAGAALAVVALVAAAGASRRGGRRASDALGWSAALAAGVALLVAGLLDERSIGHSQPLAATGTAPPPLSPLFLSFPLLLLVGGVAIAATASGVVLRLGRRGAPGPRAGPWRRVVLYLATRRVQSRAGVSALLVAASAVSVGVLVYARGLSSSEAAAIHAKAAVFVGSESAFELLRSPRLPPALAGRATEVERLPAYVGSSGSVTNVDVLGVSPRTFADVAFWESSFADEPLPQLLAALASVRARSALPVIVANGPLLPHADLQVIGRSPVALRVVARARTFPGANGSDPLLVTTRGDLDRLLAATNTNSSSTEVWTRLPATRAAALLATAGLPVLSAVSVPQVTSETGFLAVRWSFAFLSSLGVLVGLLALAGLALHLEARERSEALAFALGRRMGLRRGTHLLSLAHELAGLLIAGFGLGAVLSLAAAYLVHAHLDPQPDVPPALALVLPVGTLIACGVAVLATVALGSVWGQRVVERRPPSELLRHDA